MALDWKWLFIYPGAGHRHGQRAGGAGRTCRSRFKITSSSVMNSFYIPALAGQIYAMPGMETQLHAVINQPGDLRGLFGQLQRRRLLRHALQVPRPRRSRLRPLGGEGQGRRPAARPRRPICELEKPSEREPVRHFATVDPDLYDAILNICARPGKMCMSEMMAHRRQGRRRHESHENRAPAYDDLRRARPRAPARPLRHRDADARRRRHAARGEAQGGATACISGTAPTAAPLPARRSGQHRAADTSTVLLSVTPSHNGHPKSDRNERIACSQTDLQQAHLRPPHLGGAPAARADPARHLPRRRRSAAARSSARSPTSACGASCGASGSPASTTRRSASCTSSSAW